MKRKWIKPKLIILYRGRPEEMILATCKLNTKSTGGATGPSGGITNCRPWKTAPTTCGTACSDNTSS